MFDRHNQARQARSEDTDFMAEHGLVYLELAGEIPIFNFLDYSEVEGVAAESQANVVNKLTNLKGIIVSEPVQDIERFLHLLKN